MKETKEWFGEWFDTPYYHVLYKNRDHKEAERFIHNLVKYLDLSKKSKIIDIACGKGRHSVFLNKENFDVTGVDLSQESIDFAKKSENEMLHFEVHDMRKVFREDYFDLAVNLFTSFGYFEDEADNQLAVNAMSASLKERGVLVLDFLNPNKVIPNLVKEELKTVDSIDFHIKRYVDENNFITKEITFSDHGKNYTFHEKLKAIDQAQFQKYFEKANLQIISTFGSYDLENYNPSTSDRMIFIAKKQN